MLRQARVRCETHVVYGNAPQAIIRTARRLNCDSIVMGTRGLGAIGNVFLGSVASKVIHLSPVPVTLIR
jgi:nucleotide-binding universal stress UspA family protein